jgi:hypothetical protein
MASNSFGSATSPAGEPDLADRSFGTEAADVRSDIEEAFVKLEIRDGFPELEWLDLGAAGGVTADGSVNIVCKGSRLLNGMSFATLTVAGLTLDAVVPGEGANSYIVDIVDTGSGGLSIGFTDGLLLIDQGGSASDEDTIATALNNASSAAYQVIRANSAGGGAMAPAGPSSMAGGEGTDFAAFIAGVGCPPLHPTGAATAAASVSNDEITLDPPDLTSGGAAAAPTSRLCSSRPDPAW